MKFPRLVPEDGGAVFGQPFCRSGFGVKKDNGMLGKLRFRHLMLTVDVLLCVGRQKIEWILLRWKENAAHVGEGAAVEFSIICGELMICPREAHIIRACALFEFAPVLNGQPLVHDGGKGLVKEIGSLLLMRECARMGGQAR